MRRAASYTLAFFVLASAAIGCDPAGLEPEPMAEIEEDIETAEEMIVGLWNKEFDGEEIDWLFKEGGSYLAGQARPVYVISGRWSIEGDTLHIHDNACFDAFATYRVEILPEMRNRLSVTPLLDECVGRKQATAGVWERFIYGE